MWSSVRASFRPRAHADGLRDIHGRPGLTFRMAPAQASDYRVRSIVLEPRYNEASLERHRKFLKLSPE